MEVLKQIAPSVMRAAVIRDPDISAGPGQFGVIQSVAPSFGVEVSPINVRDAGEIERDVTPIGPNSALFFFPSDTWAARVTFEVAS
jgi:putative tryptophan/tyrosine transport system substrate-binding protein